MRFRLLFTSRQFSHRLAQFHQHHCLEYHSFPRPSLPNRNLYTTYTPLRVIGVNALAAYLIHALLNVHELNQRIFSGAADFFPPFQPVLLAVSLLLLQWLVLLFFYRRRVSFAKSPAK